MAKEVLGFRISLIIGLSNSLAHSLFAWRSEKTASLTSGLGLAEPQLGQGLGGRFRYRPYGIGGLSLAYLGILLIIVLGVLDWREEARSSACVFNLKEISQAFNLYAADNGGKFPTISKIKNNFIFEGRQLYPKYLNRPSIIGCPMDPHFHPGKASLFRSLMSRGATSPDQVSPDCITGDSYCYLGWAVIDDEQAEAFFRLYDKLSPEDYDKDIQVPEWKEEPSGYHQGGALRRLVSDLNMMDRYFTPPSDYAGSREWVSTYIPVIWDRAPHHREHGRCGGSRGGMVLYLDGHVEFVRWEERFPMTEAFAKMLEERKRQPILDCDE